MKFIPLTKLQTFAKAHNATIMAWNHSNFRVWWEIDTVKVEFNARLFKRVNGQWYYASNNDNDGTHVGIEYTDSAHSNYVHLDGLHLTGKQSRTIDRSAIATEIILSLI